MTADAPDVARAEGVGAPLPRKEDDRPMRGRGQYVGDIRLPGLQDVTFVRSPLAHARIRAIHVPEAYRDRVFTAADLDGVSPIRAVSELPGLKVSEQPVLPSGKVRQVSELVALCVTLTRAEARTSRPRWSSPRRSCPQSTTRWPRGCR